MVKTEHKYKMSEEGLRELKLEFKMLSEEKRPQLKEMIEEMRDRGDLSENDGYTLALEDFESNERRLAELNDLIENAVIIETHKGSHDKVMLSCKVTVEISGKEITYTMVGTSEANPLENKLSAGTPLGKAIMGKKVGESCKVILPIGDQTVVIKKIS